MKRETILMNFSGIYRKERFYKKSVCKWIECADISETNCFCSDESATKIENLINECPPNSIHFLDSGNYHYLTKLWTDKIKNDFSLIVFDHHTDAKDSEISDTLSCGNWLKKLLIDNPNLKKAILIGVNDQLINGDLKGLEDKLIIFPETEVIKRNWELLTKMIETIETPVYLSVDKDVLDSRYAKTNWDNGSMTLEQLNKTISYLKETKKIIGVDICGEETTEKDLISTKKIVAINNKCNSRLLSILK